MVPTETGAVVRKLLEFLYLHIEEEGCTFMNVCLCVHDYSCVCNTQNTSLCIHIHMWSLSENVCVYIKTRFTDF